MQLRLEELLRVAGCQVTFAGDKEALKSQVSGISSDSREIKKNEVFFALKGDRLDGHDFITNALQKGALAAVVTERWYRKEGQQFPDKNFFIVDDTLKVFQELAHFYRLKFKIPVIAITGSNGKTTTKEMTAQVLSKKFCVLKNRGNLNNHIGVPLTLFELDASHQMAVVEMGTNHFGEIKRLAEIAAPDYGLITNIGKAHLEFFNSLDGVAKAKMELWEFLELQQGSIFLNVDDERLRQKVPSVKKIIRFGFKNEADVKGKYLGINGRGYPRFTVMGTEISLNIAGVYNIYNALAAASVGLEFNLDMPHIKEALESFLPTSKRMELIRKRGLVIINDSYNSNPDSAKEALTILVRMATPGKRIAVLGDMLELGSSAEQEHRRIGKLATTLGIDILLAYGPLSQNMVAEAKKSKNIIACHFQDKKQLVDYLKNLVKKDDVVLVKGSRGMAMEEVVEDLLK